MQESNLVPDWIKGFFLDSEADFEVLLAFRAPNFAFSKVISIEGWTALHTDHSGLLNIGPIPETENIKRKLRITRFLDSLIGKRFLCHFLVLLDVSFLMHVNITLCCGCKSRYDAFLRFRDQIKDEKSS